MRCALKLHTDSRCPSVNGVEVGVERTGVATLTLDYLLTGDIAALRVPRPGAMSRDELWKHTCFEAFVRAEGFDPYYEFNFATSLQSAAYGFDSYRSGMRTLNNTEFARIETQSNKESCELKVWLQVASLSNLPSEATWCMALSAVIEDASGLLSFWALSHSPGKPDFHNSDCFDLVLPPAYPWR